MILKGNLNSSLRSKSLMWRCYLWQHLWQLHLLSQHAGMPMQGLKMVRR